MNPIFVANVLLIKAIFKNQDGLWIGIRCLLKTLKIQQLVMRTQLKLKIMMMLTVVVCKQTQKMMDLTLQIKLLTQILHLTLKIPQVKLIQIVEKPPTMISLLELYLLGMILHRSNIQKTNQLQKDGLLFRNGVASGSKHLVPILQLPKIVNLGMIQHAFAKNLTPILIVMSILQACAQLMSN